MSATDSFARLDAEIADCRACPRLVAWREQVAREKRASYAEETYWGRPVPGFGDEQPAVLVVGLAPAAHGANRTGRMFTGDRSGDWLFASLHRVGLANQPTATSLDDGLRLRGVRLAAAVRCAPPENKPTPAERDRCASYVDRELALVADGLRVVVTLGAFGWDAALGAARRAGWDVPRPKPRFGHGTEVALRTAMGEERLLLGCYHPSQHNTFTGRLTEEMTDDVLGRAARVASLT
ncbi:MAG: uracil-DNA glycosylase [Nocardioides sp.]|nr:uracil-DNA glycosylase [Nocardioides sp.]